MGCSGSEESLADGVGSFHWVWDHDGSEVLMDSTRFGERVDGDKGGKTATMKDEEEEEEMNRTRRL